MGKLARMVDWAQESSNPVPRALDSGICLKAVAFEPDPEGGDFDDDSPTRPYERIAVKASPSPRTPLERSMALAVSRLGTLSEWLSEGEDAAPVVAFVRSFLTHLEELNFVVDLLREKTGAAVGLGEVVEAFANAASVWRANLVDYVDELALTQYRSLDAWTSLPEYSSTYVLAFISPTLAALKERIALAPQREGIDLLACVWGVEAAIVRFNWMLSGVTSRDVQDVTSRETLLASGW